MVTSTTIAHTLAQTWRVAFMFSVIWFLQRWKTSLFLFACESFGKHDQAKIVTLDRVASGCLCVVGLMGSALACGVAVYPTSIVGGIVGMSIAYATRDILETICSGLSIQFLKPFSLGDTVKVGSVEGRVVEMGLVTTWLLNDKEIPVMIPNSMFASQAVSNKSRPPFHAMTIKIPIPADDTDKAPGILNDIESMLRSNPNVFLGKEPPHCFLSQTENSSAELTLQCNLKNTNYQELPFTKSDIFLRTLETLKEHGFLLKKEDGAKI
ncbi:hypothetical protein LWI29_015274 [Acer saccharum]|uniref:Mechanosensitive ion channel MscS domain-containing protein n=1 Tax=Acer saccharum TaxID=4024 RepID=A0AA39RW33_ACESA|nr:hypothetical protein LWI29_015274 [Acer saccharum]